MFRFALVVLIGCGASSAPADLKTGGEDAVRRFFALVESGDCAQLEPQLTKPETCAILVKDFKDTHSHLSKIAESKIDGRDPQLVLVTVEVQSAKHAHSWIVRAKWTANGWRMTL